MDNEECLKTIKYQRSFIILLIVHVLAEQTGIEPVPLVFQTNVHTKYTTLPYFMSNK